MTDKQVFKNIIKAWESLPGGENYSPKQIEKWLVNKMGPAINKAREQVRGDN
jgi:hypothetical protein